MTFVKGHRQSNTGKTHFKKGHIPWNFGKPSTYVRNYKKNRIHEYMYSKKIRKQILEKFGKKCNKCGFSDIRALQIDHVNGGGMKEYRTMSQVTFWKKVLTDTTGTYQLLCANCNWIKRAENKEHTQRKKIELEVRSYKRKGVN